MNMLEFMIMILIVTAFFMLVMKRSSIAIFSIFIVFILMFYLFLSQETIIVKFSGWEPPFGIVWVMDRLSAMMGLLITSIAFLVSIYSIKYVKERQHKFFALVCLMIVGLLGVTMTGDIFNMYVFLEILSLSCYGLVAFNLDDEAIEGAMKYVILGPFSTSFALLGIAMLYGLTGTLNIADLSLKIVHSIPFNIAFAFLISGFALKAAIVPFHFWLPDVHPVAPSPISAMLSSVVVGTGIYAVLRIIFTVFGFSSVFWLFIAFGLITMVIGGVIAIRQKDIKRMIAYSTVSQSGYIFLAIGLGSNLGVIAGLFHLLNNIITKAMLFLIAGVIIWHTKTKDMNELGGLGKNMNLIMICFAIGALSMAGLPPLNGFASKWLIYLATWETSPILTAIALIVSGITLIYYMKAFSSIFLGPSKQKTEKMETHTPKVMLIPIVFLAIISLIIGLFPQFFLEYLIDPAANALLNQSQYINIVLGGG
ncbi:MAG: proton-conducting transporter membrane subunit [Candidatus Aenigmatarchaeota archaeon]